MNGRLTTHVLDLANGCPAAGLAVVLYRLSDTGERRLIQQVWTDQDGRCGEPLLSGDQMRPGQYELLFAVGEYFARCGLALPDPAFLQQVPVRFGIAEAEDHYHVPLLVSPWGYSTYRGS